jgi:hypothetical protein
MLSEFETLLNPFYLIKKYYDIVPTEVVFSSA